MDIEEGVPTMRHSQSMHVEAALVRPVHDSEEADSEEEVGKDRGACGLWCMRSMVEKSLENTRLVLEDYADDIGKTVFGKAAVPIAEVNAPTPRELWFSYDDDNEGWPERLNVPTEMRHEYHPPKALMPSVASMRRNGRNLRAHARIGTLRVEVLQCERLQTALGNLAQLGTVDPYAVILFERYAGRTNTLMNERAPCFTRHMARAFELPVTCPYSTLHVAIVDEDFVSQDDGLGRIVLELGALKAGTEYDCWFPLQYGTLKRHVAERGAVRLRLSLTFENSRARLLSYLKPLPTFAVPFADERSRSNSAFALYGPYDRQSDGFRMAAFQSHLAEIRAKATAVLTGIEDFLFYKAPGLSLVVCALWQVLVSYPQFALAMAPLVLLVVLLRNLADVVREHDQGLAAAIPIRSRSSVADLGGMLVLGRSETPLSARPVDAATVEAHEAIDSEGDEDDDDDDLQITSNIKAELTHVQEAEVEALRQAAAAAANAEASLEAAAKAAAHEAIADVKALARLSPSAARRATEAAKRGATDAAAAARRAVSAGAHIKAPAMAVRARRGSFGAFFEAGPGSSLEEEVIPQQAEPMRTKPHAEHNRPEFVSQLPRGRRSASRRRSRTSSTSRPSCARHGAQAASTPPASLSTPWRRCCSPSKRCSATRLSTCAHWSACCGGTTATSRCR